MDKESAFENVKKYISFLKRNDFSIRKAYIFGSYAKGTFNDDSDIDLAVVMNDLSNSFTMQVELMKISRKFDTRIEPHPFDEADFDTSHPFAHEILTTGVQIL
jgi:predicted nucleotidyltransferase